MIICTREPERIARMIWNLPNTLTWLRIFAIPLVIVLVLSTVQVGAIRRRACCSRSPASPTRLDGYFARRMGPRLRASARSSIRWPTSSSSAVALVLLVSKEMPTIIVPGLEGLDGGARDAARGNRAASSSCCAPSSSSAARSPSRRCANGWPRSVSAARCKVSQLAKYKTILQIVGLSCMLFRWNLPILPALALPIFEIGLVLTVVAAVLTLISGDLLSARRAGPTCAARHDPLGLRVSAVPRPAPGLATRAAAERWAPRSRSAGLTLVYGGGRLGLMGIVADAALAAGGRVIGVIPRMLIERELRASQAHDAARRRHHARAQDAHGRHVRCLRRVCRAAWARSTSWSKSSPGRSSGLHAKPVVLANIDNYFAPMYAMLDHAVREKFVTAESRARWRNADSVTSVMRILAKEGLAGEGIP